MKHSPAGPLSKAEQLLEAIKTQKDSAEQLASSPSANYGTLRQEPERSNLDYSTLQMDYAKLQVENQDLRAKNEHQKEVIQELQVNYAKLQVENQSLRAKNESLWKEIKYTADFLRQITMNLNKGSFTMTASSRK
ncbi:hypothetical protein EK21DRAFT_119676 [Setomelanomma holmii]|uniref:Uncharacterized protein n=1 Tax=Setomelanomma holmii TaxID=210430 RepID=A0A9P4LFE2_9PLEO|nr:hypothetical protein EK21DRAFT_119676 [Setomelanomma holmii]